MSTQQSPSVLLVDLSDRASGFQRALSQLGIATKRATKEQVKAIFDSTPPRGVIASAESTELLVAAVRGAALPIELPVFVLAQDEDAPIRGRGAREITAVVPQDVDPGVLSLRLKTALQHSRAPKADRHPTLMGFGETAESKAVTEAQEAARAAMASVLSLTPAPPGYRPPAPPGSKSSSRRPSNPVPAQPRPAGAAGVGTQNASVRPPSAAELNPFAAPVEQGPSRRGNYLASEEREVHTSAPPIPPSSHPPRRSLSSDLFTLPENPIPKNLGQTIPGGFVFGDADNSRAEQNATVPPSPLRSPLTMEGAESSPAESSRATPSRPAPASVMTEMAHFQTNPDTSAGLPVTTSLRPGPAPADGELSAQLGRRRGDRGRAVWYGGAGLAAALAVGVTWAVSGSSPDSEHAARSAGVEEGANAASAASAKPTGKEEPPASSPPLEEATSEPVAALAEASPAGDADAQRFRIQRTSQLDNCETLLGKKPEDFASRPKWHAASAWKQARKNLMAGKQEAANELMCQAAFIDPSGPATSGLVKFYLSHRALDQAETLAERGIQKGSGGNRELKELLGDVLSQRGEIDKARALWLETMKLSASDTKRLEAVVRTFVKSAAKARRGGDTALAERLLRRAAAFEPQNAIVAAELALVLQKNEQRDLAERWAKHALELDGTSKAAQEVLKSL